jgi:hypothetical protein
MVEGTCLCGAVTIEVARAPDTVTSCNCSACRRLGAIYAYYPPDEVRISGPTVGYVRHDLPDGEAPGLALHHCPTCGCTTHWAALDPGLGRMGVNARLLAPQVLAAARLRRLDGADTWTYLDED